MPSAAANANPACRIPWPGVVLGLAVLGTSVLANTPHALGLRAFYAWLPPFRASDSNKVEHLGGENLCIAQSLVAGRGFSDPFGETTGPTAWMPPILPAVEALLLRLCAGVGAAAAAVVLLQDLVLIYTGLLVLRVASRSTWRYARAVALAAFLGETLYHFIAFYMFTHDSWIILLALGLLVDGATRLWGGPPRTATAVGWGILGGLAALVGPVLAPVWAMLTANLAVASRASRSWAVALVVAAAIVAPWMARNYAVFHRFVPIKSNLFFELYQSNCLEPDGVLRFATWIEHPYSSDGTERSAFKRLGEMRYLDSYRGRFLDWLRSDPRGYLMRVGNRLLAATLVYYPFFDDESKRVLVMSYLLHPLPFYGMVLVVTTAGWWRDSFKLVAFAATAAYLAPYVLVAYYERYALPLIGLQSMFIFWGVESVRSRLIACSVSPTDSPA